MDPARTPLRWFAWGALVATIAGIAVAFIVSTIQDSRLPDLPVIAEIPDFAFTNQNGQPITKSALLGRVTLADVIFTRCGGPCPVMTGQMSDLQRRFPADAPVRFLTLTTDPSYDTPAILKQYATRFKANDSRWWFLTGPKHDIAEFIVKGLKLVAQEKAAAEQTAPEDLFIHSTMFVVLDKQARVRGGFDSDDPEFQKKVQTAVQKLTREKMPEKQAAL